MGAAYQHPIFDEPTAADASSPPTKFKFAPTFVIDFTCSLVCVLAITPAWKEALGKGWIVAGPTLLLLLPILVCYFGKTAIIGHLGKKGGDARTYVKSGALVTDGPYGYSRHPTYVAAMIQFLLWSVLALYVQAFLPWNPVLLAAALGVPVAFYLINDLVVMPTEEAMLRKLHPDEFDAYAAKVNRWVGRKG